MNVTPIDLLLNEIANLETELAILGDVTELGGSARMRFYEIHEALRRMRAEVQSTNRPTR